VREDEKEQRIRDLEAELARLYTMLESAPNFITRATVDGRFLYVNRLAPGYRREDVIGASICDFMPPSFHDRVHESIRRAIATREVQSFMSIGQTTSNTLGHYLARIAPVVEGGVVTSLVMIATDITELEDHRLRLCLALEASKLGIWTHDPQTGHSTWDETTHRILGLPEGLEAHDFWPQLIGSIHPDDRERIAATLATALTSGRCEATEYRIRWPDGTSRWVEVSGKATRSESGSVVLLVAGVMDITERRLLETRLLQAQKLESIGRLSGGLAHDFNNILTLVLGNLEFALEHVQADSDLAALLHETHRAATKSTSLTAQLMVIARRQLIRPQVLDPNALLTSIESLLRRVLGPEVEMIVTLEAGHQVEVDPTQLEQVVLNLVTNARDAMPHGGRVVLRTRNVHFDEATVRMHPGLAPGNYVEITVQDTGVGITSETRERLFEPFFSTRKLGMGLGLATCYGLVKQSGGHIHVDSEPGRGSTFHVYLPGVQIDTGVDVSRTAGAQIDTEVDASRTN